MYERIVVGTDGTATASQALDRAFRLASLSAAEVHVVSVARMAESLAAMPEAAAAAPQWIEASAAEVASVLDQARLQGEAANVATTTHACSGEPADAICRIAEQVGADLVVVGNRGMKGMRRVLGSVPNRVAHRAGCDVLVVATT